MSISEGSNPNSRPGPQSTAAQDFSTSLNETFAIENNPKLEGLLQSVEQKKQAVTSQSQELEALEAKLRETEARLNQKAGELPGETTATSRRKPVASTFSGQENDRLSARSGSPPAAQPSSDIASASTDQPASQGHSRWEGLMPQGNDQKSR